jgi:Zn-dependent protease with chaperone function
VSDIALPLLGSLFVFGVVMPTCALVSRTILWLLRRQGAHIALHGNGALRYALLIAPTAIPLGWLISACLHQAEAGTGPDVCASPDPPGVLCPDVSHFAVALVLLATLAALPKLVREYRVPRGSTSLPAMAARARLSALAQGYPELVPLLHRLVVTDGSDEPIATRGVYAPRVVVDTSFVSALDDPALLGALRHEAEHVRDRDPLRYFVAWWALAANPIGRWGLRSELARWIVARETHCDREAVLAGASAPALAHALVAAARFPHPAATDSSLAASDIGVLRLRVELLMAYAEHLPSHCCRAPALRSAVCVLLLAVVLPHGFGANALDVLHRSADVAASYVTGDQSH